MHIHIEADYNSDDNKGVYVHFCDGEESDTALIRIENSKLIFYESQNGFVIGNAIDGIMTEENMITICTWLSKNHSNAEIEIHEVFKRGYGYNDGRIEVSEWARA
jgi:hypothetical protein